VSFASLRKAYDQESAMLTSLQGELRNVKLVLSSLVLTTTTVVARQPAKEGAFGFPTWRSVGNTISSHDSSTPWGFNTFV